MSNRIRDQKKYMRNYYLAHSIEMKKRAKEWKKKNPENVRLSRQKNRGKSREYMKEWRKENRQYLCVHGAKKRCRKTDMPFDLDRDWTDQNYTGYCALTGISFKNDGNRSPYSVSLDRIDNQKGYLKNNCRFVLFGINTFKGSGTDNDMYLIANQLLENKKGFKP